MGEATAIEWADKTINFFWGCTKVSPGCDKCYMFRLSQTFGKSPTFHELSWINNEAKLRKWKPSIIFVNSMSDSFHEQASIQLIDKMFDLMKKYSKHQYIILTKRINRAFNYFKIHPCPDNCWIGTSIENRASLHRMAKLKKIEAKIRFVSFEPLLENLYEIDLKGLQWVIVGGESDFKNPRLFDEMWGISIMTQCKRDNVPFFYKQFGGKKKVNGTWGSNELNGKKYLEMPILLRTKESTQFES